MSSVDQPRTIIRTRGHRERRVVDALIKVHQANTGLSIPIRIVCISDTHNKHPVVPLRDIFIHAGDPTDNGSFEVQNGLTWLSSLPHKHKILVAGNHDVLFDDEFLTKYPERRYGEGKNRQSNARSQHEKHHNFRQPIDSAVRILGFQYHPNNSRHWKDIFASLDRNSDVIVTHGQPHLHLDKRDFHRAECSYIAEEVYRVRPLLHMFGHIHASYGRQDVRLNSVQQAYDNVLAGSGGWIGAIWMAIMVIWAPIKHIFIKDKMTTFVNAAVVGGSSNELQNAAVIIDL